AEYVVLDHPDGRLTPHLEAREELIGLIRRFRPDLLLTVRPVDYHPDHRAAGQLVVDASYLLTVPLVRPDVPIMERMPVICYTYDQFRKPLPFEPDVVVSVDEHFEQKARMLACHESQFFEWLPYNGGYLDEVPTDEAARWQWHIERCGVRFRRPADAFRDQLVKRYGPRKGGEVSYAEAFELCEYGRQPDGALIERLFPA
ncbi:MAG: PIG-L deacetylase family protein, partial [Planctomycetota bacterium]